jgi:SNF2 family DNA or RNA helicase
VVGNWEREINRFAPALDVVRHHGPDRPDDLDGFGGVLVTSYGTLRRDIELLEGVPWDVVALDEAQQVKNPSTAAAQAVRRLSAQVMFALTGTPLENRLAELWAVMDATNRGLMGSSGTFNRRFVGPVEVRHDADAASRLRRLVSPFIMRRTKDNPEVAKDLPDKIERTVSCSLTAEQAALYTRVTEESLAKLADADGIGRRGQILALLTALKQVANHPAQYLKQDGPIPGRSGKLAALREITEAVTDAGDAMLVFTQFTRMGDLLTTQLQQDLGVEIPFLHGGLTLHQRDQMVEEFQQGGGSPVLLISTRAGGTGLNLTAATHVVHYDRWWNPAVEDQATDRAHRIGQHRTVEVHKLVTAGTLEERIAEMLDRKRALADAVVGSGETWITELDDDALAELVRLSADAPLADPLEEAS